MCRKDQTTVVRTGPGCSTALYDSYRIQFNLKAVGWEGGRAYGKDGCGLGREVEPAARTAVGWERSGAMGAVAVAVAAAAAGEVVEAALVNKWEYLAGM